MSSSWTFLLCKPDVFIRKFLQNILEYLHEKKFQIIDYYFRKMDPVHYKLMYQDTFSSNLDDWSINQKIYNFGPCLGLLLNHNEMFDPTSFLNESKGSALPFARKETTIRAQFLSKSRVFNLIHVADKHSLAMKEALSWFGTIMEYNSPISMAQVFQDYRVMGYTQDFDLDPEKAFIHSKIRFFYMCRRRYPKNRVFDELISFYRSWEVAVQREKLCEGVEGTILYKWQRIESEKLKALPKDRDMEWFLSHIHEKSLYYNNYLSLLGLRNIFLSDLESYLITLRLKYKKSRGKSSGWSDNAFTTQSIKIYESEDHAD